MEGEDDAQSQRGKTRGGCVDALSSEGARALSCVARVLVGFAVPVARDKHPVRHAPASGEAPEGFAKDGVHARVARVPVPPAEPGDDRGIPAEKSDVPDAPNARLKGKEGRETGPPGFGDFGARGEGQGDLADPHGMPQAGARRAGPEDRSRASKSDAVGGASGPVESYLEPCSAGFAESRVIVGERGEHGMARSNGGGGVDEDTVALAVNTEGTGPLGVGDVGRDTDGPGPPAWASGRPKSSVFGAPEAGEAVPCGDGGRSDRAEPVGFVEAAIGRSLG